MSLSDCGRWLLPLLVALGGCAQHSLRGGDGPPLPDSSAMPCCFFSQETIELQASSGPVTFIAALANEPQGQTLAILDTVGNKVMQASRNGMQAQVSVDRSEGRIPQQLLWLAINMLRTPAKDWPLPQAGWSLQENANERRLLQDGREWAKATGLLPAAAGAPPSRVSFAARPFALTITSVSSRPL